MRLDNSDFLSDTDSDAEIVGTSGFGNPELPLVDNEDFELINFKSNTEIKAETLGPSHQSSVNFESREEDNEDFVLITPRSNAKIEAKPAWSSTLIQDSEDQLENINVLLMMQAFALAASIYSSQPRQQRPLPLPIEYKRRENPEIPRLSLSLGLFMVAGAEYYRIPWSILDGEMNSISSNNISLCIPPPVSSV